MNTFTLTYIIEFLIFVVLFFCVSTQFFSPMLRSTKLFSLTIILVVAVQIIAASFLRQEVGDVMLFSGAGHYLRHQVDFYWIDQDHTQYPFLPFLIFLYAGLNWLTTVLAVNFSLLLKIFLLIPLHYLGKIIQRHQERQTSIMESRKLRLQFLLHPVTYSVIFFHGQTDVVLIAFLFAASNGLIATTSMKKTVVGALNFAASIAAKTWSILFLPLIIKYQVNVRYSIVLVSTMSLAILLNIYAYVGIVFGSSGTTVINAISAAGGPIGVWGISLLLTPWLEIISSLRLELFVIGLLGVYVLVLSRKMNYWKSMFIFILGLYIIMINWGIQYMFWIIPSLYFLNDWVETKFKTVFMTLASVYTMANYINIAQQHELIPWQLIHMVGVSVWIVILYGFISHLRRSKRLSIKQIADLISSKVLLTPTR